MCSLHCFCAFQAVCPVPCRAVTSTTFTLSPTCTLCNVWIKDASSCHSNCLLHSSELSWLEKWEAQMLIFSTCRISSIKKGFTVLSQFRWKDKETADMNSKGMKPLQESWWEETCPHNHQKHLIFLPALLKKSFCCLPKCSHCQLS